MGYMGIFLYYTQSHTQSTLRGTKGLGFWADGGEARGSPATRVFPHIPLYIGGFPKLGVGVSIIRTIVFWGLYWGPLI